MPPCAPDLTDDVIDMLVADDLGVHPVVAPGDLIPAVGSLRVCSRSLAETFARPAFRQVAKTMKALMRDCCGR